MPQKRETADSEARQENKEGSARTGKEDNPGEWMVLFFCLYFPKTEGYNCSRVF